MTDIALFIDLALYVMMALTAALIVFKCVELTAPRRLGHLLTVQDEDDVQQVIESLERGMPLLAVIASTGAFVGLAGTVAHIMTALASIKGSALDITLISGPIATSLKATLLGLASAIPASVAHHLLSRRLEVMEGRLMRSLHRSKRGMRGAALKESQ